MEHKYALGLDYGTNSVRALIVDVADGSEIATSVWGYQQGDEGVVLDPNDPDLARQHPQDYLDGLMATVKAVVEEASTTEGFSKEKIIGIGVDTTGSTPIPVDAEGKPLAFHEAYKANLNALAWLWKDHTSHEEARRITEKAAELRPDYLAKIGGTYSSEWFWAKVWHCHNVDPEVAEAAHGWIECADWIPAVITGTERDAKRGICAAGHKGLYHDEWGGYPEPEFLRELDPRLERVLSSLPDRAVTVSERAGVLSEEWATRLGLPRGTPVGVGAFDAHTGGIGSGIDSGILVKNVGTSTCDMMVEPLQSNLEDVPGLCGIVPGSILPGFHGMEAGQSAVGDIFNWFVRVIGPKSAGSHKELEAEAAKLAPGQSGLLALDWHAGNRTILVDQRLSGLIMGLNLQSTPPEIYRALIEATAFGARVIMERFKEFGVGVERVINCGGISTKSALVMKIYADVMNRTMEISRSGQTAALGSAIIGSVVAGTEAGGHSNFAEAIGAMTGVRDERYEPDPERVKIYDELFRLYHRIHDAFGTKAPQESLYTVMKELLSIRDKSRQ